MDETRKRQRSAFVAGLNWAVNAGLVAASDPAMVQGAARKIYTQNEDAVAEFTWGAAQYPAIMREWDARHEPPTDLGPVAPEDK